MLSRSPEKGTPAAAAASGPIQNESTTSSLCVKCGQRNKLQVSTYSIEDLDAITESKPRETCNCDNIASNNTRTEFRWELHTSNTDTNLIGKTKCINCKVIQEAEEDEGPHHRLDLRKHHSAEIDKWSFEDPCIYNLRKHNSDDGGQFSKIRENKWNLQVPEVHPNPKPKCNCTKTPFSMSVASSPILTPKRDDARKLKTAKWLMKTHISLPDKKSSMKIKDPLKSKSLKDRQRYSIRKSLSPESQDWQMTNVRRLISPDINVGYSKWMPYQDTSPLPDIGMKKRNELKHIGDVEWTGLDNITPPDEPPPIATPICANNSDDFDEQRRWKFLNQISPFPLYQGAWKDESPIEEGVSSIWSPQRSTGTKKSVTRAQSEGNSLTPGPPSIQIARASSEEPRIVGGSRQRPQLTRSKALLEVPGPSVTKRSLSEEVPTRLKYTNKNHPPRPNRARSEEASKYHDPWLVNRASNKKTTELRQYVTTV